MNAWYRVRVSPSQLLTGAETLAAIEYSGVQSPHVARSLTWTTVRDGTAHGLIVWFDSILSERIRFSNAPGLPELIYAQGFFPFPEPVSVSASDRIEAAIRARLIGDDYAWFWNTSFFEKGNPSCPKTAFEQSTFPRDANFHGTPPEGRAGPRTESERGGPNRSPHPGVDR